MLLKLKNILYSDEHLQEVYKELAKHITDGSAKEFVKFEQALNDMMSVQLNQRQIDSIKDSKCKLM
jgi:hypothetical protein